MKRTPLTLFLLLATVVLLLQNCSQSGLCEGSLTLENLILDTTVAVGDTLFIDLTDPPVFVSSEGRVTYDSEVLTGLSHVDLNFISNPNDNGDFSLFLIIGESVGEASAELKASSGCLENSLTFNINTTEQ